MFCVFLFGCLWRKWSIVCFMFCVVMKFWKVFSGLKCMLGRFCLVVVCSFCVVWFGSELGFMFVFIGLVSCSVSVLVWFVCMVFFSSIVFVSLFVL